MPIYHKKVKLQRTGCCGIRILSGIENHPPEQYLIFVFRAMYYGSYNAAFILFSDKDGSNKHSKTLSQFIEKNKLGTVKQQGDAWLWEVKHGPCAEWLAGKTW